MSERYKCTINLVLNEPTNWFNSNLLTLNYGKSHFLQCSTRKLKELQMQITSPNSAIININSIKFLGLNIDTTLSWKDHIMELSYRLNKACYTLRAIKPFTSTDVMKSIYYSHVHSILAYGIIFWGNSCFRDNIFRIKKRIRVITNSRKRDSCRELFKTLQILTLQSQYIFSLLVFVVKNRSYFVLNSDIHYINTRFNQNLHLPTSLQHGGR
jgi:hypothetical protein